MMILLISTSLPRSNQVLLLLQCGQVLPNFTVSYSFLQLSHQVTAGMRFISKAQPFSNSSLSAAQRQQSVRYEGTIVETSPMFITTLETWFTWCSSATCLTSLMI